MTLTPGRRGHRRPAGPPRRPAGWGWRPERDSLDAWSPCPPVRRRTVPPPRSAVGGWWR